MAEHTLGEGNIPAGVSKASLRLVLMLDAVACGAFAIIGIVGAAWLSPHLGLPETMLRGAGLVIVPWAVMLVVLATRSSLSVRSVGTVIVVNLAWVVASIGLLLSDAATPTNLGIAVVIAQAVAVLAFAGLQFMGLRRDR